MALTRATVSVVTVASLVAGGIAGSASNAAFAAAPLTKAEYLACQTGDEGGFKSAIEAITFEALSRSLATFDYKNAVADSWRTIAMDDVIDKQVDTAVADVGKETSWSDLLASLAYQKNAQELATRVAERVYRADLVKSGIEGVATSVGRSIGQNLEFATQDAAGPAIACVKAFLGQRYGGAVSAAVSSEAESEFNLASSKGQASVSTGAVIAQSSGGIAGAAILVVRRQLANMAQRVGQRIVGSVLSRLVSVAAGGIGTVLIAKDIWELRSGVLPIIATEMKSSTTKQQVQAELAKSISDQIGEHVKDLAAKTSERIVEIWQEFRRAHLKTIELADREPKFRAFLDTTAAANLPRLDEVVGLVLSTEGGEAAVLKRLADGSLNSAVNTVAPQAMEIARETHSLETALKWVAVSGDLLPQVFDHEIYRHSKPDEFTKVSLTRLLAIDDRLAITRLASVSPEARETLFELDAGDLKALGRALTESELGTLSRYLTGLEKAPRDLVLKTIAATPARMQILASDRVRQAVVASQDQMAAVDMLLRTGGDTPGDIVGDIRLAIDGKVSPWLIWERHPAVTLAGLIPLLVVVLLLRRIFAPRRRGPPPPAAA